MSIYIVNFVLLATALITASLLRFKKDVKQFFSFPITLWLLIFVGLRHEVGGDWGAYLSHYENLKYFGFVESLTYYNPGLS